MQRRSIVAVVAVVALIVAVAVAIVFTGRSSPASSATLPALQGTTLQGKPFDLAQVSGKPTVVNFFASWCPPCNSEAPDLARFAAAHPGVQFVGVAVNDANADTASFVAKYGLPYTIVMDPNGAIAKAWGADAIPRTVFIDAHGAVKDFIVGAATTAQFEERLLSIQ